MELKSIIDFLTHRRSMLDETIASLEKLSGLTSAQTPLPGAKRRGRKSMDAADRQKVSERMKQYWASRRSEKTRHAGGGY